MSLEGHWARGGGVGSRGGAFDGYDEGEGDSIFSGCCMSTSVVVVLCFAVWLAASTVDAHTAIAALICGVVALVWYYNVSDETKERVKSALPATCVQNAQLIVMPARARACAWSLPCVCGPSAE